MAVIRTALNQSSKIKLNIGRERERERERDRERIKPSMGMPFLHDFLSSSDFLGPDLNPNCLALL